MHKIFGVKEKYNYFNRRGAYFIPIFEDKIAVVETPKGFFLLGGGNNKGESDVDCITRECLEECGYEVRIIEKLCSAETYCKHPEIGYFHPVQVYYYGEMLEKLSTPTESDHILKWVKFENIKGKLYLDMQNWAIEQAWSKYKGNL